MTSFCHMMAHSYFKLKQRYRKECSFYSLQRLKGRQSQVIYSLLFDLIMSLCLMFAQGHLQQYVSYIVASYFCLIFDIELFSIYTNVGIINFRDNIRVNQEWTIQRHWQHLAHKTQDEGKQTTRHRTNKRQRQPQGHSMTVDYCLDVYTYMIGRALS